MYIYIYIYTTLNSGASASVLGEPSGCSGWPGRSGIKSSWGHEQINNNIYIYIYIYTYICICIHIHIYIYIYTHAQVSTISSSRDAPAGRGAPESSRAVPGKRESSNLSREILRREILRRDIGRIHVKLYWMI